VTLPKQIRETLKVKPGDRLDFVLDASGEVRVRAGRFDVRDLKGLLHRSGRRPVSLEAMNEAIARRGEPR
jgi:AbrB family looped-hinge helix DNA binding protein